jgi:hypothetical protein
MMYISIAVLAVVVNKVLLLLLLLFNTIAQYFCLELMLCKMFLPRRLNITVKYVIFFRLSGRVNILSDADDALWSLLSPVF